ncbi:MAG: 30S ribosomal protein S2 [Patescibacteria group bacterium]|jgi:small subunit ribosomal protein S2
MPHIPSVLEMLKAGVHFGHRTSRWHPKMKQYIFGARGGVHVIDIEQTRARLEKVTADVESIIANGGNIMFIGTKKQVQDVVEKFANECGMPFVNTRWLGGTFTNFPEIHRLIKTYLDLKDKREKGELKKYTKLEQLQFDRKIDLLDNQIGGISILKDLPDAVFVLDMRHDKTAVQEARLRGIKVIGICDTNVNPEMADEVIPANDDSIASVTMITKLITEAVHSGKTNAKKAIERREAERKARQEELAVTAASKATVEELDNQIKEKLANEKIEKIKTK